MSAERNEITSGSQLEKYLVVAKTTKGKACGALIKQALDNPATFVFGELLDQPNIKALAEGECKDAYDTLCLFAYGTFEDYHAAPDKFLALTDPNKKKLKQLSLVSIAAKQKSIPYSVLLTKLDIKHVRELEDLIIDSIYTGVISGKLDQKEQRFQVDWCMGRDVRPGELEEMVHVLNQWCEKSENLLKSIEDKIKTADFFA